MTTPNAAPIDLLDQAQFQADPAADAVVARILGPWDHSSDLAGKEAMLAAHADQWERLAAVSRLFAQWQTNGGMADWRAVGPGVTPEMAAALEEYVRSARALPDWADPDKIQRAEKMFMDYGPLSVTLLFCSSLPECYVIPDLAAVLNITGQLVTRTEYRIRSTGAMVFPVMMHGGLTDAAGGGVAQILKVRLIHATIRNLILRGNPELVVAALGQRGIREGGDAGKKRLFAGAPPGAGLLAALPDAGAMENMHHALYAHGWDTAAEGLPCNQEELAYTLLTFSYVILRGMRTLGHRLSREEEEAYLHAWNVAGHVLGIRRELMADTMEEAEALFATMQARGRADKSSDPALHPDPRPALGRALIGTIQSIIPGRILKAFPLLLTRHLCGRATAQELGLNGPVSWLPRLAFTMFMLVVFGIDTLVRLVVPGFSISRFLTRLLGYHFLSKILMDLSRPLKLPENTRSGMGAMMDHWGTDAHAPAWINALEDRWTGEGGWNSVAGAKKNGG
ncbi:MAG: DUF2236 domain-containing protein [Betaproteobacteria bacterium]|nr:DUF2236 domain-containing protein [Betaproteobacteria bacterium]